jgi:hypothetical protein
MLAGIAVLAGVVLIWRSAARQQKDEPAPQATPPATSPSLEVRALPPAPSPVDLPLPSLPSLSAPEAAAQRLSPAEALSLNELIGRLQNPASAARTEDLRTVEAIFERHAEMPGLRHLLVSVLVRVAGSERSRGQLAEAEAHLRRAAALDPSAVPPRLALVDLLLDARNWNGAETAARELLSLSPQDTDALDRLAFGLFRQDRSREAADTLRERLAIHDSTDARSLLARVEKGLHDEAGMTEQHLAHFNVRYDGDTHDEVGREVLRALERHYATLVTTLDYEPTTTIPVVLFSRDAYFDASGAPRWSGGVYDLLDGRIRVPIGGLDANLTPEMEKTLIHELTHAFAAELTAGLIPREITEGLAQYEEGKRTDELLGSRGMTALADGRIGGVMGFYLNALSLVEYLVGLRGAGGINELLRAMGETRSVDGAFQRVYGSSLQDLRSAWEAQLRQQHGR